MSNYTYSTTIDENNSSQGLEIAYSRSDGLGDVNGTIKEPLLNTEESCDERATAEFLEKSYKIEFVEIETFFREDLNIGDIFSFNGIRYKIISQNITGKNATIKTIIKGKRWN